jgi:hypothetical protein
MNKGATYSLARDRREPVVFMHLSWRKNAAITKLMAAMWSMENKAEWAWPQVPPFIVSNVTDPFTL